jgi:hypothetical protein
VVATHLAWKKLDEGQVAEAVIGVVELSQFALRQQEPLEDRSIRSQRQPEYRQGPPEDLSIQECGFGHHYG